MFSHELVSLFNSRFLYSIYLAVSINVSPVSIFVGSSGLTVPPLVDFNNSRDTLPSSACFGPLEGLSLVLTDKEHGR